MSLLGFKGPNLKFAYGILAGIYCRIQYTEPFIKNRAYKAISIMHKGVTMRLRYDVGSLRALVVTWKVVFSVG